MMLAETPNLNMMAQKGTAGAVMTTPEGYEPGSDVTNMGILGYDPTQYYTGRAPLEAAAMGINLGPNDVAFRCNLVTLATSSGGVVMDDFSAGHIATEEARELINALNDDMSDDTVSFYPGVSYRHLLVWRNGQSEMKLTPPHNISDQDIRGYMPSGPGAEFLTELMSESQIFLKHHEINQRRALEGKKEANSIWLWGQGKAPYMPSMRDRKGINGAMISAVDLMRGIGVCAGMKIIRVPGATGWIDTNYEGKVEACLKALEDVDFVFVHVEAPDEAGHVGSIDHKIQAISDFDKKVVGPVLEGMKKFGDYRVMALSDHPTPVELKTHVVEPVPFAIYPPVDEGSGAPTFDESIVKDPPVMFTRATSLWEYFIEGKRG